MSGDGAVVEPDGEAERSVSALVQCALRHGGLDQVEVVADGAELRVSPITPSSAPVVLGEDLRDLGAAVAAVHVGGSAARSPSTALTVCVIDWRPSDRPRRSSGLGRPSRTSVFILGHETLSYRWATVVGRRWSDAVRVHGLASETISADAVGLGGLADRTHQRAVPEHRRLHGISTPGAATFRATGAEALAATSFAR